MGSVGSTSNGLLDRVRAGNVDAWQQLFGLYAPLVYGWCRRAGLQESDAADIGQEVFRTVAARIATFRLRSPEDTFRGWLWTITRNKIGDHFRSEAAQPHGAGGTTAHAQLQMIPEQLAELVSGDDSSTDDTALVRRVLDLIRDRFEVTTWQAFWRATVAGQDARQIAQELGITPQAVRQAKYRVLRQLRQELHGLSHDDLP